MLPGFRISHPLGLSPGNIIGDLFYQETSFLKLSLELSVDLKLFPLDEVIVESYSERGAREGKLGGYRWSRAWGNDLDIICQA